MDMENIEENSLPAIVEAFENSAGFFPIHVQIKISLSQAELNSVNSNDKAFSVHGVKYPIMRFGSWAIASVSQKSEISNLLNDGGLVVAIIWGLYQSYGKIAVWVNDPSDYRFVLEVEKNERKRILDEISGGEMASKLEATLKDLESPNYYANIKIKLIKIIEDATTTERFAHDTTSNKLDQSRLERLEQMEKAAQHMTSKQYDWAISILKQCLNKESDPALRLQILMRAYTCAIHLKKSEEMDEYYHRIIDTLGKTTLPPSETSLYAEEYQNLSDVLITNLNLIRAIELGFAFQQVITQIPDDAERFDLSSRNIQRLCKALKSLFETKPGVYLKLEIRNYVKKVHDEIDRMKRENYCDTLLQAQAIYYSEFVLAEVEKTSTAKLADIFQESSIEFKRVKSCWADFPYVITRLRQHKEISKYLKDDDYVRTLRKISARPALLEKYLKDEKIAQAHDVLSSEFGLFSDDEQKESEPKPSDEIGEAKEEKPIDNKTAAQLEKEKGNEAYKKLNFREAHEHYQKAIELDPKDAMLHCNQAAVFISEKKYDLAKGACKFALQLAQQNLNRHDVKDIAKIYARLARAEHLSGQSGLALALYQQSLGLYMDEKVAEQMKECNRSILSVIS